jgi:ankyrin repeat protein
MTDIGEWAESRRLKIEQQLSDVMAMIETDNATAFARRAPLSIAQLNSSVRGRRALVHAVVHNRVEMARTLLAEGANANLSDTRGLPLMCAVTRVPADLDMLRVLLRFGADASVVASSTAIALPLAALLLAQPREPLDLVQFLVDSGRAHAWWPMHVHWRPAQLAHHPIIAALDRNWLETVHFLLARRSAALHCEDAILITRAITTRNLPLLKLFLDAGVAPNVLPGVFLNPPIFSVLRDAFDATAFRMILDADADVNAYNSLGETPLHVAVSLDLARWIFDALIKRGANPNAWNMERGGSPLTRACLADALSLAVFLTTRGASPDQAIRPKLNPMLGLNRIALSRDARLLLAALGATDPVVAVTEGEEHDYLRTLKAVEKERFTINRSRLLQICTALQELELPALVLHEIVFMACGEVPMHLYWTAITCVKHFHNNNSNKNSIGKDGGDIAAPAAVSKIERRRVRRQTPS